MKYLFFLFCLLSVNRAWSYANFIGHGYTSCLNCHYNPSGGGPLNDYGRAVDATAISSRAFYPKTVSEEQIAEKAGFLFRKPKQNWLRTQINYRGFQLVRQPGSRSLETDQWINMQLDGRVILKFGENDRFVAVGNYGYAPRPMPPPAGSLQPEWRSREHYFGYRFTPKVGLYAGLMDKVYGLKVIEHIAYSRMLPQVAQNDQVHALMGHYIAEKWETTAQLSAGNLYQDTDLRMKGGSFMTERTVLNSHRIGGSFLNTKNNYLEIISYSTHARLNLKEGSALLAEIGETKMKSKNGNPELTQHYGLLQTYLRPTRGLYILSNIEYRKPNTKEQAYTMRWGPGVQYFPIQRLELRFDLYNTRNFSQDSSTRDSWMYLLQTHVWL